MRQNEGTKMNQLHTKIQKLINQPNNEIQIRLQEFKALGQKSNNEWFSELCFCLLTANSKAITAIQIQKDVGEEGFFKKTKEELSFVIRKNKHRFHNKKSEFIILARKYRNIKDLITPLPSSKAREFLVKNIKGLGFKEASHFLRNVGRDDVAIIDRHILRFMKAENMISDIPKSITPKKYVEFEGMLKQFNIPLDLLDLVIWHQVTGVVLK